MSKRNRTIIIWAVGLLAGLACVVALATTGVRAQDDTKIIMPEVSTHDTLNEQPVDWHAPAATDKALTVQPAYTLWVLNLYWTQQDPNATYMCVEKLALGWSSWRFMGCGATGLGLRSLSFPGEGAHDAAVSPQIGDRYRITFYRTSPALEALGTLELTAPQVPNVPGALPILVPQVASPLVGR